MRTHRRKAIAMIAAIFGCLAAVGHLAGGALSAESALSFFYTRDGVAEKIVQAQLPFTFQIVETGRQRL